MKNSLPFYLNALQKLKPLLAQKYKVSELAIFGSYARGEENPESDLDILVTYSELPNLFSFIELMQFLEETLDIKVDLVIKDDLKPRIAKHVLAEKVDI
jgi:uncharacterized protein